MGAPKALLRDDTGNTYLARAISVLRDGGCEGVIVVAGAEAGAVGELVDATHDLEGSVDVVTATDWDEGMGASLRAGLSAALDTEAASVLVSLVDLPDVGPSVVRRVLRTLGSGRDVLGRASYDGVPGHPVLIGRDHWAGVLETAHGDKGARDYLAMHRPTPVECGDLATGRDVDTPEHLSDGRRAQSSRGSEPILRRAERHELDRAVDVWRAANPHSHLAEHPSNLKAWADGETALLAVAVHDGRFVAMGLAVPQRAEGGTGAVIEGSSHLTGLSVLPDYQGQGVGGRLLDFLLATVQAGGATRATAWVHATNAPAQAYFASRGFRPSGCAGNDADGERLVHLVADLST